MEDGYSPLSRNRWFIAIILVLLASAMVYGWTHPTNNGGSVPGINTQCSNAGSLVDVNCQP